MSSLTILNDTEVKSLLHNLHREEVEALQKTLRDALYEYSTNANKDKEECSFQQPERQQLDRNNGTTTLFMPSTSSAGIGMKVVTLGAPRNAPLNDDPDAPELKKPTPRGSLTLFNNEGQPTGFVNAEELTAFRTALASSLLIVRRHKPKEVVVFGAGKQAFWHVRLTLMFHGATIERINIINHRFSETSRDFYKGLLGTDELTKRREGWQSVKFGMITPSYNEYDRMTRDQIRNADIIFCTTPSTEVLFDHTILTNPSGRVKGRLIIGVGSFKPHMIEIPPEILLQAVKLHGAGHHFRKRAIEGGVVLVDTINALGETGELTRARADGNLHANNVIEIGEIVMVEESYHQNNDDSSAIDDSSDPTPFDEPSPTGAKSPSSSLALAFREQSFESTNSSKSPSRKSSFSNISRRGSRVFKSRRGSGVSDAPLKKKVSKEEEELSQWLHKGNVIYKSVGLGLMDLVVGTEVVRMAKEKGIGATFKDF
ncbi:hypothetical protein D0Z07_4694 [Hyphodiscus hymeniophilus]|uniref:Ornithine cyclodeaminase n=1 Tax=Hyphodiscus hymeniophilus TaxID=353542 RepID=A0A9P6VJJ9_9HELO|nr:hypothetical protein D0Z07_4694 [Hyphodiscus hymeniophilus]